MSTYLFWEAGGQAVQRGERPYAAQNGFLADGGEGHRPLRPRRLRGVSLLKGAPELHPDLLAAGGRHRVVAVVVGVGVVALLQAAAGEPVCEGGPAEGHSGEGEDQPGGAAGERVQRAEGQAHAALTRGQGVAHVDGRDGLHQEAHHQVGEADVGQQQRPA